MGPRQAQLALLSFAIVAAAIVLNVLVLQKRPAGTTAATADRGAAATADRGRRLNPAASPVRNPPPVSAVPREEPSLRIARFAPDPARLEAAPAAAAEDEADSATISAIQRELKQRNYGPLPVDGFLRPATRAAIMAYEFDRGLPLTGEATGETLKLILLGAPASGSGRSAGEVRSVHAEGIIRNVQKALGSLGYQPGAADGRLGEETIKAIRDFEMDRGQVPKGRISAGLLAQLAEAQASARR
jgi:peptidoglycan hydrolase-like protein with peptidoglycan-binding domain